MLFLVAFALGAPAQDKVPQLPGFAPTKFAVYSGYLHVPGPFEQNPYDSLAIHYQFHESQNDPTTDPLATWHNGGPGSSSIDLGLYTEMGYFQTDDEGEHTNPYAWNQVASMLYLESPAGSGGASGFSMCQTAGAAVPCQWNDTSQAEAYAHTLTAFYKADMYYGKGLSSKELYEEIYTTCKWPDTDDACNELLGKQSQQVGPHNIYNIYDNCAKTKDFLVDHGINMFQLQSALHHEMDTGISATTTLAEQTGKPELVGAVNPSGGYPWACGGNDATRAYLNRSDVMKALHLQPTGQSKFNYHSSGPASITLHPELANKLRVLIYNGDADACVPYKGNEEWITSLVKAGNLTEAVGWKPWFNDVWPGMPAGYVTSYNVTGAPTKDFTFLTIRLAGHMVPTFQPASSLSFFTRFLQHKPF